METGLNHAVNAEATQETADQKTDLTINRNILIQRVFQCGEWLEQKAKQKRCISSVKIQAMRGAIHSYHVVLEALKDAELDKLAKEVDEIKRHIGLR